MCRLLLMTVACLLILFGISGLWMMPKLIQQKIEQRMQLKIGTKAFDRFTKVPIPLTVKFYIFNVTNSEQVLSGLERPKFKEVGPFMYKQWRRREIIDLEDYNRRLKYKEIKTFYPMYPPDLQPASIDNTTRHNSDTVNNSNKKQAITSDSHSHNINTTTTTTTKPNEMLDPHNTNVTIINLPLLSILTKIAQLEEGSWKRSLAGMIAKRLIKDGKEQILITKPANQLLFDGYRVDFMESTRSLVSDTFNYNFDSPLPRNKFGFFYMKNNTWTKKENGELTVFTGRNDSMSDFMLVHNWNDQKQLNVWPTNTEAGDTCNQIKGTDGSQFHPGVTKNQILKVFSPMICTSIYIKYKEDTQARDIPLLRFSTPPELFAAPKKNPKNACYCTVTQAQKQPITGSSSNQSAQQKINDSRCYLDGLMDLSLCRGAPIAASSPHFYNADPMLAMAAGLTPDKRIHETYIDIEPMTGSVFRAASRAQLNAYVEQAALDVVDSSIIGSMTPMVAPLIWLEEAAEIDEKSSIEFKNQLLNLVQKWKRSFIYSIAVGIMMALLVSVQFWYITCYSIDTKAIKLEAEKKAAKFKRGSRSQMHRNIQLGGGARKSNLAAMKKSLQLDEKEGDSLRGDTAKDLPLITRASISGIQSSASSRAASRRLKRSPVAYGEEEEEELSKRMLVADEWDPAVATNSSSSGNSTQGIDNQATNRELVSEPESHGEGSSKDEDVDLRSNRKTREGQ